MIKALSPGAINVTARNIEEAVRAATIGGFDAVEIDPNWVLIEGREAVKDRLLGAGLKAAAWGLPVEWRKDEGTWQAGLAELPRLAEAAASVGATRCPTWVLPFSDERPMAQNLLWHVGRFTPIARILADHGCSLGLEFIGPYTLRQLGVYPFVYTLPDMLDLAKQIGPNVGLLVDAFHWYTSHGTVDDIRRLTPADVVYVHVNDAIPGRTPDEQIDNERELPAATGVIDIAAFLGTLKEIGYNGPVTPEPFKSSLKDLPSDEDRLKAVGAAMDHMWQVAGL